MYVINHDRITFTNIDLDSINQTQDLVSFNTIQYNISAIYGTHPSNFYKNKKAYIHNRNTILITSDKDVPISTIMADPATLVQTKIFNKIII